MAKSYPLSKFLPNKTLQRNIDEIVHRVPSALTPGESQEYRVQYKKVPPLYQRYRTGGLFTFRYRSMASEPYRLNDKRPIIIIINKGRIVNFPNGRVIFGININYMDIRLALAFARILSRGSFSISYNELKNINKRIAGALFRSYYISGISDWQSVDFQDISESYTGGKG